LALYSKLYRISRVFLGAASVVFLVVFVLGFAGVALYYSYKKGAWRRLPAYQYSVLNQFEHDPDDETGDLDQV
jgi:hypothetical protein